MGDTYSVSMAAPDLSALTVAQLEAMRDNLIAAHAKSLTSRKYKIGSRELEREDAGKILEQLSAVSIALGAKTATVDAVGLVRFDEQT